jgi:alpha-glucosidase
MRAVLDEYDERMMVGEIYLPLDRLMTYYGDGDECHMPFNFQLIQLPWNARAIGDYVRAYEAALPSGGWPNWVLGNHDQHRIATRVGPAQARVAQMLLLTLRGTPTCYYGDEIGMVDVPIPFEECMDPAALQQPELFQVWGRDPERTPMQWDDSTHAGFSRQGARPWLPLAADYRARNVGAQQNDPTSMLALFRQLTALRRAEPALNRGAIELVDVGVADVLAYRRTWAGSDGFLVLLNLSGNEHTIALAALGMEETKLVLSTYPDRGVTDVPPRLTLAPNTGVILRIV